MAQSMYETERKMTASKNEGLRRAQHKHNEKQLKSSKNNYLYRTCWSAKSGFLSKPTAQTAVGRQVLEGLKSGQYAAKRNTCDRDEFATSHSLHIGELDFVQPPLITVAAKQMAFAFDTSTLCQWPPNSAVFNSFNFFFKNLHFGAAFFRQFYQPLQSLFYVPRFGWTKCRRDWASRLLL